MMNVSIACATPGPRSALNRPGTRGHQRDGSAARSDRLLAPEWISTPLVGIAMKAGYTPVIDTTNESARISF